MGVTAENQRFQVEQVGRNLWYIHDVVEDRKLKVEVFDEVDKNRIVRALNIAALIGRDV